MTDAGCWAYALTGSRGAQDLSSLAGVAGTAVRPVPAGGLTLLVSDVDLDEFGAEALARNLEDLDWLERAARAHHEVIDAATRLFPVLPMRLATVYSGEAVAVAAVRAHEDEFAAALDRVRGRAEWGVKAYQQQKTFSAERPAVTAASGGHSRPGMAYLSRRRGELAARKEAERDTVASVRTLHADLAGRVAGAVLHAPQSPQLSGARTPMLLNASYLVEMADGPAFTEAVTAAAGEHPDLRVELTGPWPPYSFAGTS